VGQLREFQIPFICPRNYKFQGAWIYPPLLFLGGGYKSFFFLEYMLSFTRPSVPHKKNLFYRLNALFLHHEEENYE